jgi:membrane peptidoglycan carboxypeptidase
MTAWFAGLTSNLLTVVWVGYDDDRDLDITGAQSALPIWTEFMKRTAGLPVYKAPQPFGQPHGIETAEIDNLTNLVALADPALTHSEVFITGTEPFVPVQEESTGIASNPNMQSETMLGGKGSPLRAEETVLFSDTQGHTVPLSTGSPLSTGPSQGSHPLGLTKSSTSWSGYQMDAAGAGRSEASLPNSAIPPH